MSGTSLDGVDLAFCEFIFEQSWEYRIICAETIAYPQPWKDRLSNLINSHGMDIEKAHIEYGRYLGSLINEFIGKHDISPDFISSHGHTVFHRPEKGITVQIGDGKIISGMTGLPVVYDFRTLDVKLGGQGAPLVPVGDRLLFGDFKYCLNLGGIANISYEYHEKRIAFDICPVNMVLNHCSKKLGFEYDNYGHLAQSGNLNAGLLNRLNVLDYYKQSPPKSLGREWVEKYVIPLIDKSGLNTVDILRTFTEHIVFQSKHILNKQGNGKIMITGGGAKNKFLISRLRNELIPEVIIPDEVLVDYKEAMIFAFLGVLRFRNEVNCLASVTGASRDSCSGLIVS